MTVSQPTFKGKMNEKFILDYFESSLFINNMKEFDLLANLDELSLCRENSNRQKMRNGHLAVKLSFELT